MKFRFISKGGAGLPVIKKLQNEGNEVDIWISEPDNFGAGLGWVPRVDSWKSGFENVDAFVFDMVGLGDVAKQIKRRRGRVFAGHPWADEVELDRSAGLDLMQSVGIQIPETREFNFKDIREPVKFLRRRNDPYVIKPHGNMSTSSTFVADSGDQAIAMLEHFKEKFPVEDFSLQRVVDGIEVSHEGWFDGQDWIDLFNITFEDKRFMTGEVGPNTGCMGSSVYESGGPLSTQTLHKITQILRDIDYRGPIDINLIVSESEMI
jgi:phosphoribosylamine--glycine ligase